MRAQRAEARRIGRAGFTLVELLVTLVVLSVAALVVIPSMGETGVLRTQSIARTVVADITFAQADAMAYQTRRLIWFGMVPTEQAGGVWSFGPGNGYTIAEVTGPLIDLSTDHLVSPDSGSRPYSRDFGPEGNTDGLVSAAFGEAEPPESNWLIFDELGGTVADLTGPEPGPAGVVSVTSGLATYEISVEPLTGRVSVERTDDD